MPGAGLPGLHQWVPCPLAADCILAKGSMSRRLEGGKEAGRKDREVGVCIPLAVWLQSHCMLAESVRLSSSIAFILRIPTTAPSSGPSVQGW